MYKLAMAYPQRVQRAAGMIRAARTDNPGLFACQQNRKLIQKNLPPNLKYHLPFAVGFRRQNLKIFAAKPILHSNLKRALPKRVEFVLNSFARFKLIVPKGFV